MKLLPLHLALRLENIFSKEEITALTSVFSQNKRPVSFRVNTLLSSQKEIEEALVGAHISYMLLEFPKNCFLLENSFCEPDLWKLDIYKEGKIYIQGISSQIPVHFFSPNISLNSDFSIQDTSLNSPLPGEMKQQFRILDACAAPGGKTSQLAALYPEAEIYAFEPQKIRFEKMLHNLKKLGATNVISLYDSVENISKYIKPSIQLSPNEGKSELQDLEYFDMILIDAPCSGEGALHISDTKFLENWSMTHIRKNYARQKVICDSVLPYLKTGGEMIYSTCTIAPEENEGVIHYLLCKYTELSLENIDLGNNKYINIKRALKYFEKYIFRKEISEQSIRVIPSEFSEGFYMAKLRKGNLIDLKL